MQKKGRAPEQKPVQRQGVEMRVDVQSFGANHADKQQRKPVLARGQPVNVQPLSWGQQNAKQVLAALADAKLHDTDATRVVSDNHEIDHSRSAKTSLKRRTNRGRKASATEAEKIK